MIFHYNIQKCRHALVVRNLEQKDLAEPGLSESVISKFFRGVPVRHKTANRIVEKLGLAIEDVLHENGSSKSSKRKRDRRELVRNRA